MTILNSSFKNGAAGAAGAAGAQSDVQKAFDAGCRKLSARMRTEKEIRGFLKQNGFVILERNYRCKLGEIDIIAKDGKYFVFIEVKFRASGSAGFSLEAIDHRKAMRIRNAAVYYLFSHHLPEETPCRFDAAGIDGEEITYIRNAF